jgi:hypothetical protein
MVTESQIREQLANYLVGESSLDTFDDWLTGATWNIHQAGEAGAERLAYAIELLLSEHSSGHLSDAQLDDELKAILRDFAASVTLGDVPAGTIQRASLTAHLVGP